MISTKCKKVTWVLITKKVWSSSLKKNVNFAFLCWSLSHDYNYEMTDNDIADQLQLVYMIMRFQRNNKWWWALFLWAYEVTMVNSYVSMKRYCELKGVAIPQTHHDWNETIGYTHVDPVEYWPRRFGLGFTPPTKQVTKSEPKKATSIDSKSLSPTWHRKGHLDTTKSHMPVPPSADHAACQLHRWAYKETHPTDKMKGTNIKPAGSRLHGMRCETCAVNLCLKCF